MAKGTKYPTLSPMEAGYLILLAIRQLGGEVTGGNWGNKTVRSSLLRLGLIEYGDECDIKRQDGRGTYKGHPVRLTDIGMKWAYWFNKGQNEPRNSRYNRAWIEEKNMESNNETNA